MKERVTCYWKLWGHFYCDVSIACGGFWFRGHLVNQLNDLKWQLIKLLSGLNIFGKII